MGYRWFRNSKVLLLSPLLILLILVISCGGQPAATAPAAAPAATTAPAAAAFRSCHYSARIYFPEPSFQCGGYGRTRPCGYNRTAADRCRDR